MVVNTGTVVLGILNGLTIGLLAVGLVLVYKSNRFLNLAHGQLGAVSAMLLAKWVRDWGWNWWVAFAVAVILGTIVGLIVERLFVGPLRRIGATPTRLLLLSLGVSQLLLALTFVPALNPDRSQNVDFPQPFVSRVIIGGTRLTGMDIVTAVLVPALVVALALFMRYSVIGKQIRAAANNPDAARLCGISINRVSAITWALAGGFAAVAAVIQGPNQPTYNLSALGPYLLMLTLGAAAFGAFVSLPGALLGGLVLGVIAQVVSAETADAAVSEVAVFVVILAVVLVRGKAIAQVFSLSGVVTDDLPVTRVPAALRDVAIVRYGSRWLAVVGLVLAITWPHLPYFDSNGNQFLLSLMLVYALVGVTLTMLLGWAGQVSLGHFGLVGLGAFLAARWSGGGWTLAAQFLVIGSIAAAVTVAIGLPALRVRGLTLAVTTLGFAVISADWLYRQQWIGGDSPFGATMAPLPIGADLGELGSQLSVYYAALVVLALTVAAGTALRHSMPGRTFLAVRDNERASSAFGISPAAVKLSILAVSGFFAGVAGVLWASAWKSVTPLQFSPMVSLSLIALPVIGGLGSLGGAVAAAALLYGLSYFVGPHVQGLFGDLGQNLGFTLFLSGSMTAFVLLKLPTGIAGLAQHQWQRYLDRRASLLEQATAGIDSALPLRVQGVRVRFGGVVALDEPDIEVRPGEIVGLIGTNGAGKSTLMNVISGHLPSERGSVRVFGQEVIDLPPELRAIQGVGRSFQDASLFAGLTVRETIQVALAYENKVGVLSALLAAPWSRAIERSTRSEADEIIDRLGLGAWADTMTAELSTGTRRICGLAAQLAVRPKLLLLDEPTAGVAQREAEAFGPLLRQIRDELDCAVLIVEHDMPLLMGLCDRVYALETGSVIAEGSPDEIRNDPLVVASYLGTQEVAISRSGAVTTARTP